MRTPVDALRSVARYTAVALGPEWEVRMSGEKGTFARPFARVIQVPSMQFVPVNVPQMKLIASYSIVAQVQDMQAADSSQLEAMRVAGLLYEAYAGRGVDQGRTYRVPLYDYDGIPLSGPDAFVDESNRDSRDFMHIESPPDLAPHQDPNDENLWSVAANIRMSWLRSAAVPSTASTVVNVPLGADIHVR